MYFLKLMQGNRVVGQIEVEENANLLEVIRKQGLAMETPCGGRGTCGKCKVLIKEGPIAKENYDPEEMEKLSFVEKNAGMRLACKVRIKEDMVVELPAAGETDGVILTGGESQVPISPMIRKEHRILQKPSLENQMSDLERLEEAFKASAGLPLKELKQLPTILRENQFDVTAVIWGQELIGIEGGDTGEAFYGLAVDIGTTTMAGYLLDLKTGRQMGVSSALNPQRAYGADVISRIDYTIEKADGLKQLQDLVVNQINRMIEDFESKYGFSSRHIYHTVLVGNTIMMHILAGLPVKNIAVSPFIPVVTKRMDLPAEEIGMKINPTGRVTILPMIAGYVGADTVGAIMACDMAEKEEISLMIDIGTNGEIALGNRDRIMACSTAAGPAFEGAHIRHGMGGVRGAVNTVEIKDRVLYTTIGSAPAKGICGSGIVDAVAQLLRCGILESSGRMKSAEEVEGKLPPEVAARIRELDGKPAFLIAPREQGAEQDIYLTQKDIREVQLAKAAVAAGIQILMKEMDVSFDDIAHVYLAGGFGNYINYNHACVIGLIPKELGGKIVPIGNGAGVGAKMALLSRECLEKSEKIRQMTQYIELSSRLDFQMSFVDLMEF